MSFKKTVAVISGVYAFAVSTSLLIARLDYVTSRDSAPSTNAEEREAFVANLSEIVKPLNIEVVDSKQEGVLRASRIYAARVLERLMLPLPNDLSESPNNPRAVRFDVALRIISPGIIIKDVLRGGWSIQNRQKCLALGLGLSTNYNELEKTLVRIYYKPVGDQVSPSAHAIFNHTIVDTYAITHEVFHCLDYIFPDGKAFKNGLVQNLYRETVADSGAILWKLAAIKNTEKRQALYSAFNHIKDHRILFYTDMQHETSDAITLTLERALTTLPHAPTYENLQTFVNTAREIARQAMGNEDELVAHHALMSKISFKNTPDQNTIETIKNAPARTKRHLRNIADTYTMYSGYQTILEPYLARTQPTP